jgi:hypothetical protein
MNGRSQMQGGKNWIFPKEINANSSSETLIGWKSGKNTMGPNGGSGLIWTSGTELATLIDFSCCVLLLLIFL